MFRKLLRPVVPVVTAVAVTGGAFFAVGAWRRAGDTKWCRDNTAAIALSPELLEQQRSDLLERQHSACIVHRQRQRSMFGAIWRTGGEAMANCGIELAKLQLVGTYDAAGMGAILARYGLDPAGFEASSRADQSRFIDACLAHDNQASR